MKSEKAKRTARRVIEQPRAAQPAAPEPTPAPEPAAPAAAADDGASKSTTVRKLALIYADGERAFDVSRMERSTIERFRVAYLNTPELHPDNGDGLASPLLDASAVIGKAYELVFGAAAAFAVRARKLSPQKAAAFVNPERIAPLIPRTEKVIDEKFGAKLRDLPPAVQLGLDIVATLGLMLNDAAAMSEDEPAPGAPTHAPGQEVRH